MTFHKFHQKVMIDPMLFDSQNEGFHVAAGQ
eukprot:CAMPEP_0196728334 /NCGR_PEP_ID=MMETSP1091-20130531/9034_1 /TAXON_ID=302021 /ORGANISM="Rhodomonas sp., Strain CCMP768" /LENGTH=30 /DNA_ID= /DNA_START= /DNA_END= /DNA_ORIENTATION=